MTALTLDGLGRREAASLVSQTARDVALPGEVVEKTRDKYVEAYERLTGSSFDSWLRST